MTTAPRVSVVVPVLNDAAALRQLLAALENMLGVYEVIVVDGGSRDDSQSLAAEHGARVVVTAPGRGVQLAAGASMASGSILWFLHADVIPHPGSVNAIEQALARSGTSAGAFRFELAQPRWYGPLLAAGINLRSRLLQLPFGDQGLFVSRKTYEQSGGFRPLPILEDLEFVQRLKKLGRVDVIPPPIRVDSRRWDREGFTRRTIWNWSIQVRYGMGADLESLIPAYPPNPAPFSDQAADDNLRP